MFGDMSQHLVENIKFNILKNLKTENLIIDEQYMVELLGEQWRAKKAGIDVLLIGDSLGTTLLGYPTTVEVTLDHITHHTAAVSRAKPESLIVSDLPFAHAHYSQSETLKSCAQLLQTGGAQAVKIEADATLAPTVKHICNAGIPIMGHIGLLPQRIHSLGKYRKFGRNQYFAFFSSIML